MMKFFRLPRREQALLWEAAGLTGFARLVILLVPFKRSASFLGELGVETPYTSDADSLTTAKTIGRAVLIISRHTPWQSKCLVQAMTALIMLRRRGIATTLYLGVAKDDTKQMIAHAWLRYGNLIVTGGSSIDKYAVVGQFASQGKQIHRKDYQ